MSTRYPETRADAGFTLVEAIAAFVIVASVIVVVQRGIAGGLPAIRAAQKERAALTCARSILASAGTMKRLAEGQSESGNCNDVSWSMDVAAFQFDDGERPPPPIVAHWVDVTVKWRNLATESPRSLHLRTLKIGRQE